MGKLEVVNNTMPALGDVPMELITAGTVFFANDVVSRDGSQRLGKGLYYRATYHTVVNLGTHHAYPSVSAHTVVGYQPVNKAILTLT